MKMLCRLLGLYFIVLSPCALYSETLPSDGARMYVDLTPVPAGKIMGLISKETVRSDLHLSGQQVKRINDLLQNGTPDDAEPASASSHGQEVDEDQRYFQYLETSLHKVLTPAQNARLNEIMLQVDGPKSLMDSSELKTSLALSEEQRKKVGYVFSEYAPKLHPLYDLLNAQMLTSLTPQQTARDAKTNAAALAKSILALEKQRDHDLYEIFTPAQMVKWTQMQGKPIEIHWDISIVQQ